MSPSFRIAAAYPISNASISDTLLTLSSLAMNALTFLSSLVSNSSSLSLAGRFAFRGLFSKAWSSTVSVGLSITFVGLTGIWISKLLSFSLGSSSTILRVSLGLPTGIWWDGVLGVPFG